MAGYKNLADKAYQQELAENEAIASFSKEQMEEALEYKPYHTLKESQKYRPGSR